MRSSTGSSSAAAYESEKALRNALRDQGWESWRDVLDSLTKPKPESEMSDEVVEVPAGQVVLGEEPDPERVGAVAAVAAEEAEVIATRGELAEQLTPGMADPMTVGAEKLIEALLTMVRGAREIEALTKLAPAITLPRLVREPKREKIERPLQAILRGYSLVAAAYWSQQPMPREWRAFVGNGMIQTRIEVPENGDVIDGTEVGFRFGPFTADALDRATGYLRDAVAHGQLDAAELEQVAVAFAEFRTELDRARAEVLRAA